MNLLKNSFAALALAALAVPAIADETLLGVADVPPSRVDDEGFLHEDWGKVRFQIEEPSGARMISQDYEIAPAPVVKTQFTAGDIHLTQTAYRAPVWPNSVDVLEGVLKNTSDQAREVKLQVLLPGSLSAGERVAVVGGRVVLGLPEGLEPDRKERDWGCTGGVVPLPGWAKPEGKCDPAFRNISAGMGGVPIIYRFKVKPGARKTVVLGLCESHWSAPGQRPVVLYVEGAPKVDIDPIGAWGRHQPGCLRFDAFDANGDGRLQIVVDPHPKAQDKNTILNVIWIFSRDHYFDTADVLAGKMNKAADYYVDVGGPNDQLLYEGGTLTYGITLAPKEEKSLLFAVSCAGGHLPNAQKSAWDSASLRKAAADVWRDWLGDGAQVTMPAPQILAWRRAVVRALVSRAQADSFHAALCRHGALGQFSHAGAAQVIAALDYAGQHAATEHMLRAYWDGGVPKQMAALAPDKAGCWHDADEDSCAHGCALEALARHALLTGDREWTTAAWPAMKKGAEAVASRKGALSARQRRAGAVGLLGVARVAELFGLDGAEGFRKSAAELDSSAKWGWSPLAGGRDAALGEIEALTCTRMAIAREEGNRLLLLPGVGESWFASGQVGAYGLPTEFGCVSLRAERDSNELHVSVKLDKRGSPDAVVVKAPLLGGKKPSRAAVDGKNAELQTGGSVELKPDTSLHRVVFIY